jgi:hypothetical protein
MIIPELVRATTEEGARRGVRARRARRAAMRQLGNAVVILGLGIAIGVLTASYEIHRQGPAASRAIAR